MDYGYKLTTHGRAVLAACLARDAPLTLTRTAVGSGQAPDGTELAGLHQLLQPAAPATIGERRHEADQLLLTIQYDNSAQPDAGSFLLSEFMVWAIDPATGEETDFLYATLGDYRQPVPGYRAGQPASVWSFPLILVISDEISVEVTASPGLVTWEDLLRHDQDPTAHQNQQRELDQRRVQAVRTRDPGKPSYGILDEDSPAALAAALEVGPETGAAEVAAIVNGVAYDAKNMSANGDNLPDGTLYIKKMEE